MEPNTKKSYRLHGNFLDLTDLVGGVLLPVFLKCLGKPPGDDE